VKLTELSYDAFLTEGDLLEMANLAPKTTGVEASIWVGPTDGKHAQRIKVSNAVSGFDATDCFVVSVTVEPTVIAGKCKLASETLADIFDWVKLNFEALRSIDCILKGGGDTTDILASLEKLK
jgi:hypothetical protein